MKALDPSQIMQIGLGFFASKTLLSAVELEIFTILGKEALSGSDLAGQTSISERATFDFFDGLVALGLLDRQGDGPSGAEYLWN